VLENIGKYRAHKKTGEQDILAIAVLDKWWKI
jgi:hypothetical protein